MLQPRLLSIFMMIYRSKRGITATTIMRKMYPKSRWNDGYTLNYVQTSVSIIRARIMPSGWTITSAPLKYEIVMCLPQDSMASKEMRDGVELQFQ